MPYCIRDPKTGHNLDNQLYWGFIRIVENEMETTIIYWGYIGIVVEKKMETTVIYRGYIGDILGNYRVNIGVI